METRKSLVRRIRLLLVSHNRRFYILIFSILIGFFSGIAAHFLRSAVFHIRALLFSDFAFHYQNYLLIVLPITGIALTLLFTKYVLKNSANHGIAALLHSISKQNGKVEGHKSYSSILGAVLTAGFGGSVGLESPIISSGSAIGSVTARWLKLDYKTSTLFLACGAASGIAAIYNTPIAGIIFTLEVLLIDLSRFSLIPLLLSAISGAITTRILSDQQLLFNFSQISPFEPKHIGFYLLLGIIAALVSVYFTKTYIKIEDWMKKQAQIKNFAFGSLLVGILLFLFPPLWGEGFEVIKSFFNAQEFKLIRGTIFADIGQSPIVFLSFLLFLMLLKVISTVVTINAGGIGGIFAPTLFTGAIMGYIIAEIINLSGFTSPINTINFVMVGMAAVLAGVLHAPLTAIFLIAEITGGYALIVPLMLASTISFIITKLFLEHGIVTNQLAKKGELLTHNKDKAILVLMQKESLIETDFAKLYSGQTLGDLIEAVAHSKRNLFALLNQKQELEGIILLDDIREIMFDISRYDTSIELFMQIPPAIITEKDSMQQIMDKFEKTKAWNLPFIQEGKYSGFISKSRMFNVYRKWLQKISDD